MRRSEHSYCRCLACSACTSTRPVRCFSGLVASTTANSTNVCVPLQNHSEQSDFLISHAFVCSLQRTMADKETVEQKLGELCRAAMDGDVRALDKALADSTAFSIINSRFVVDKRKQTPLTHAVRAFARAQPGRRVDLSTRMQVVSKLLLANADPNVCDDRGHCALRYVKDKDVAVALINAKADVNVADEEGWTPVMCATYDALPDVVELLLTRKADAHTAVGKRSCLDLTTTDERCKALIRDAHAAQLFPLISQLTRMGRDPVAIVVDYVVNACVISIKYGQAPSWSSAAGAGSEKAVAATSSS